MSDQILPSFSWTAFTNSIQQASDKILTVVGLDSVGNLFKTPYNRPPVLGAVPAEYDLDHYFTYEGQPWRGRGFAEGDDPKLSPFPAKGYKEYEYTFTINPGGSAGTVVRKVNEINSTDPLFTKTGTGAYNVDTVVLTNIGVNGIWNIIRKGPDICSMDKNIGTSTSGFFTLRNYSGAATDPSGGAIVGLKIRQYPA